MIFIKGEAGEKPSNPIERRGVAGETAMVEWLTKHGLSYLYVRQGIDSFSSLFPEVVKRPDFLVLFESVGLIAVDVKNYTLSRQEYTLALEEEVKRVLAFERVFRIPVWYAYLAKEEGKNVWYWISALKSIEVG